MKNPKVTVLMSVYNGEKYLQEAIDSILGQTFKDFEFLIINDGSTDKTGEILESYNDPRIKIIDNKKNIGLTKSLNIGLRKAKGEYIARQDADDISMPERLKEEVVFLEMHQDYAVVGTFAKIINENSEILYFLERPVEDLKIREVFKKDNCIIHGSSMIRRVCLSDTGFYNELMIRSQDYELWLRLSKKYRLANIGKYLYMWRKHCENIEAKYIGEQKIYVILAMVKHDVLDVRQATRWFINIIAERNQFLRFKPLLFIFLFISFITFNKINLSNVLKIIYRIRFANKINTILTDFKINKIGFENANLILNNVIRKRLT